MAPFDDDAAQIHRDDRKIACAVHDGTVACFGVGSTPRGDALLELRHDLPRQDFDRPDLEIGQFARLVVEYAQRTDRQPIGRLQQCSRIEAQMRFVRHERVAVEPRVLGRVRHEEEVLLEDRTRAEGRLERRLAHAKAHFRFEKLATVGDEVNDGNRGLTDRRHQFGNLVEGCLARGVEHAILLERHQATAFAIVLISHEAGLTCLGHPRLIRLRTSTTLPTL